MWLKRPRARSSTPELMAVCSCRGNVAEEVTQLKRSRSSTPELMAVCSCRSLTPDDVVRNHNVTILTEVGSRFVGLKSGVVMGLL